VRPWEERKSNPPAADENRQIEKSAMTEGGPRAAPTKTEMPASPKIREPGVRNGEGAYGKNRRGLGKEQRIAIHLALGVHLG